jgi:hypothetical protein
MLVIKARLKANNSFNYYVLHKQNLLGVRMTVLMVFIKFARGLERVFNKIGLQFEGQYYMINGQLTVKQ